MDMSTCTCLSPTRTRQDEMHTCIYVYRNMYPCICYVSHHTWTCTCLSLTRTRQEIRRHMYTCICLSPCMYMYMFLTDEDEAGDPTARLLRRPLITAGRPACVMIVCGGAWVYRCLGRCLGGWGGRGACAWMCGCVGVCVLRVGGHTHAHGAWVGVGAQ